MKALHIIFIGLLCVLRQAEAQNPIVLNNYKYIFLSPTYQDGSEDKFDIISVVRRKLERKGLRVSTDKFALLSNGYKDCEIAKCVIKPGQIKNILLLRSEEFSIQFYDCSEKQLLILSAVAKGFDISPKYWNQEAAYRALEVLDNTGFYYSPTIGEGTYSQGGGGVSAFSSTSLWDSNPRRNTQMSNRNLYVTESPKQVAKVLPPTIQEKTVNRLGESLLRTIEPPAPQTVYTVEDESISLCPVETISTADVVKIKSDYKKGVPSLKPCEEVIKRREPVKPLESAIVIVPNLMPVEPINTPVIGKRNVVFSQPAKEYTSQQWVVQETLNKEITSENQATQPIVTKPETIVSSSQSTTQSLIEPVNSPNSLAQKTAEQPTIEEPIKQLVTDKPADSGPVINSFVASSQTAISPTMVSANETNVRKQEDITYITTATVTTNANSTSIPARDESSRDSRLDSKPIYPGGISKLKELIEENFTYPQQAIVDNISGKMILSFLIDEGGSVREVDLVQGLRNDVDGEALRVFRMMPQWTPAYKTGKAVRVRYKYTLNLVPPIRKLGDVGATQK